MRRTQDTFRSVDLFGSGKDGFTEGDPGTVAPTNIRAEDLNGYQEEIVRTIENSGLTPSEADLGQLLKAIQWIGLPFASYSITGSALSATTKFTLTPLTSFGSFSLSTNEIVVPTTGLYLVLVSAPVKYSDTTNPVDVGLNLDINGATNFLVGKRFSATAADSVLIAGHAVAAITNVSQHIMLRSPANNHSIDTSTNYIATITVIRLHQTGTP